MRSKVTYLFGAVFALFLMQPYSAFSAEEGIKWMLEFEANIQSTPAITPSGDIIVHTSNHVKDTLVCVSSSGTIKWRRDFSDGIRNSPLIDEGKIYVVSQDKVFSILPDGQTDWEYQHPDNQSFKNYLAIDRNNQIVVADTEGWIFAISSGGHNEWQHKSIEGVDSQFFIAPNQVIYFISGLSIYGIHPEGFEYSNIPMELRSGWDHRHSFRMQAMDDHGRLYFTHNYTYIFDEFNRMEEYRLNAYDSASQEISLKTQSEEPGAFNSIVIAQDGSVESSGIRKSVILTMEGGKLELSKNMLSLYSAGQEIVWQYQLENINPYRSGINLLEGNIYLYSNHQLYAYDGGELKVSDAPWPMEGQNAQHSWINKNGTSLELDTDGDGVHDLNDDDNDNDGVKDTKDAFPLDASETVDTDADGIGNNLDQDDDGDGVSDEDDQAPLNASIGLEKQEGEGEILWTVQAKSYLSHPAIGGDGTLYTASENGILYSISAEGKVNWTLDFSASKNRRMVSINDEGDIYLLHNKLHRISRGGDVMWSYPLVESKGEMAISADGSVYVIDGSKLLSIDAQGQLKWQYDELNTGSYNGVVISADGNINVHRQVFSAAGELLSTRLESCYTIDSYFIDGYGKHYGFYSEYYEDPFNPYVTPYYIDYWCQDNGEATSSDQFSNGSFIGLVIDADGKIFSSNYASGAITTLEKWVWVQNNTLGLSNTNRQLLWYIIFDEVDLGAVTLNNQGVIYITASDGSLSAISSKAGELLDGNWPKRYQNLQNTNRLRNSDDDQLADFEDTDDDNDGIDDMSDAFPLDAVESVDSDGDGTGNNSDTDDDNDGLPDEVEIQNNLNPLDATDAALDKDNDGHTNLAEHQAGTDMSNAKSFPENSNGSGNGQSEVSTAPSGAGGSLGYALGILLLLAGNRKVRIRSH